MKKEPRDPQKKEQWYDNQALHAMIGDLKSDISNLRHELKFVVARFDWYEGLPERQTQLEQEINSCKTLFEQEKNQRATEKEVEEKTMIREGKKYKSIIATITVTISILSFIFGLLVWML